MIVLYRDEEDERPNKRRRSESPQLVLKPLDYPTWQPQPDRPTPRPPPPPPPQIKAPVSDRFEQPTKDAIAAVIAAAAAEREKAALEAAAEAERLEKAKQEKEAKKLLAKKKASEAKQAREGKQVLKEKRLLKLVGAVVVKCMSKYQKQMDHDTFKKYAKEVTYRLYAKAYHHIHLTNLMVF